MMAIFNGIAVSLLVLTTLLLGHATLENQGLLRRAQEHRRDAAWLDDEAAQDAAAREVASRRAAVSRGRIAFTLAALMTLAALVFAPNSIR